MGVEWGERLRVSVDREAEASPSSHYLTNSAVWFGLGAPQELCPGELTGVSPSPFTSPYGERGAAYLGSLESLGRSLGEVGWHKEVNVSPGHSLCCRGETFGTMSPAKSIGSDL